MQLFTLPRLDELHSEWNNCLPYVRECDSFRLSMFHLWELMYSLIGKGELQIIFNCCPLD